MNIFTPKVEACLSIHSETDSYEEDIRNQNFIFNGTMKKAFRDII
jgi:hypothetical protein